MWSGGRSRVTLTFHWLGGRVWCIKNGFRTKAQLYLYLFLMATIAFVSMIWHCNTILVTYRAALKCQYTDDRKGLETVSRNIAPQTATMSLTSENPKKICWRWWWNYACRIYILSYKGTWCDEHECAKQTHMSFIDSTICFPLALVHIYIQAVVQMSPVKSLLELFPRFAYTSKPQNWRDEGVKPRTRWSSKSEFQCCRLIKFEKKVMNHIGRKG